MSAAIQGVSLSGAALSPPLTLRHLPLAAAVAILLLSACADKPPIVSADTSCERFRHISASPAQIKVYQDNWEVMESYADQIVGHNLEYDRQCIDPPPGAKK